MRGEGSPTRAPAAAAPRGRWIGALVASVALAVLSAAGVAAACPVCFAAEARTRDVYLATAIGLSLLPMLLFGGIALWIRRELRSRTDGPVTRS